MDLAAGDLVQALLLRYDPGAGIGWHRDRPIFEHVIGISLGDPSAVATRATSGERGIGHGPEVQISDVTHIDNACLDVQSSTSSGTGMTRRAFGHHKSGGCL